MMEVKITQKKQIENYLKKTKKNKLIKNIKFQFFSKENQGKGSAIRKGIELSNGDIITIQDADLEYNPEDYQKLIKSILANEEKVVYGSRFLGKHKPMYKLYFYGNKFLTLTTSILYRSKITDMETCYKMFRSEVVKDLNLISNKFDIEPELTAKILKKNINIKEIGISYKPRSIEEGKKINWKDGLEAIYALFYWKFKN